MSVEDKIAKVKNRAAQLALKVATAATLISGANVASSCSEDRNTDENGEKIEKVKGEKTSVVFRKAKSDGASGSFTYLLMENGDVVEQTAGYLGRVEDGAFLEPGDTVTYKGNDVKAVRYKNGNGKQVNFGQIGKLEKGRTD